ncbi:unnamed protein product [Cladocopium goreaui]|uniref:Uncharacterized protein n=1 Tax=Cladocopium goreaui TaxID=2562237 RepID=A0A9P1DFW1_9DINO|nr:unnamed protein product [Cladocopium goreaui]
MDMWSSHFARPLSKQLTLKWRGAGRLVVVQSITAQKSELVEELVGSGSDLSWKTFSDWDSSALLPPHVCQVGEVLHDGCRTTAKLASEPELLAAPESRGIQWSNGQYKNMSKVAPRLDRAKHHPNLACAENGSSTVEFVVTFHCRLQAKVLIFGLTTMKDHQTRPGTPCVDAMVELLQIAGKGFGPELRDFGARSSRPAMPYSGSTCTTCVRSGTSAMAGVPERAHVVQVLQQWLQCDGLGHPLQK